LNGRAPLEKVDADEICKQFRSELVKKVGEECINELLDSVRHPQNIPGPPFKVFGRRLAQARQKIGMSTRQLAKACDGMKQPLIAAMESGQILPSPAAAALLASRLQFSAEPETAEFFEIYGNSLRQRLDLAKTTTIPELLAVIEWLLLVQKPSIRKKMPMEIAVSASPSELPRSREAIERIRDEFKNAADNFETLVQAPKDPKAQPLLFTMIRHPNGKVSLVLPVLVTY
jgi:transcriptional regulator with XRE-family HTH domain